MVGPAKRAPGAKPPSPQHRPVVGPQASIPSSRRLHRHIAHRERPLGRAIRHSPMFIDSQGANLTDLTCDCGRTRQEAPAQRFAEAGDVGPSGRARDLRGFSDPTPVGANTRQAVGERFGPGSDKRAPRNRNRPSRTGFHKVHDHPQDATGGSSARCSPWRSREPVTPRKPTCQNGIATRCAKRATRPSRPVRRCGPRRCEPIGRHGWPTPRSEHAAP